MGRLLAASGRRLPALVLEPVEVVAGLAVPAALLAFGMSLHGAPRPGAGGMGTSKRRFRRATTTADGAASRPRQERLWLRARRRTSLASGVR